MISLGQMARIHGPLNALGFVLAGLAWLDASRRVTFRPAVPVGKGRREEMTPPIPTRSGATWCTSPSASGLTIWVARTLHRNGRIFLVDAFHGNEALADSVNHLLVVGFYLINIGYVTLALKSRQQPVDMQTAIELLSTKIGLVLLVLGGDALHEHDRVLAPAPPRPARVRAAAGAAAGPHPGEGVRRPCAP